MAANVRIFGCRGSMQIPVANPRDFQSDSIQSLVFPYEWMQFFSVDNTNAANSIAMPTPRIVEMLHVEVQDGASIRFEITQNGNAARVATQNSPRLSGGGNFVFGPSWLFSCMQDADPPFPATSSSGMVSNQTLVTTTPYTPVLTDTMLLMNVPGLATINLPLAASRTGTPLRVKDISGAASTNSIIINANAADPFGIDSSAAFVINVNFGVATIIPTTVGPAGWFRVG